jgi:hypothetical protein
LVFIHTAIYLLTFTVAAPFVGSRDAAPPADKSPTAGHSFERLQPCSQTQSCGGNRPRRRIESDPTGNDSELFEDLDDEIAVVSVPILPETGPTLAVSHVATWFDSPSARLLYLITGRFRC